MTRKLVKEVRLNGLPYNTNRDPQFYRRLPGQPFRLQVLLGGEGTAKARFEVDGEIRCEREVVLPGRFECEVRFDAPGSHVGTLVVEGGGQTHRQELRLDVEAEAWVG